MDRTIYSKEIQNGIRVSVILIELVTIKVRKKLLELLHDYFNQTLLDYLTRNSDFFNDPNTELTQNQIDILYPNGQVAHNCDAFDLTLCFAVLRPIQDSFSRELNRCFSRIRNMRNENYGDITKMGLDDSQLKRLCDYEQNIFQCQFNPQAYENYSIVARIEFDIYMMFSPNTNEMIECQNKITEYLKMPIDDHQVEEYRQKIEDLVLSCDQTRQIIQEKYECLKQQIVQFNHEFNLANEDSKKRALHTEQNLNIQFFKLDDNFKNLNHTLNELHKTQHKIENKLDVVNKNVYDFRNESINKLSKLNYQFTNFVEEFKNRNENSVDQTKQMLNKLDWIIDVSSKEFIQQLDEKFSLLNRKTLEHSEDIKNKIDLLKLNLTDLSRKMSSNLTDSHDKITTINKRLVDFISESNVNYQEVKRILENERSSDEMLKKLIALLDKDSEKKLKLLYDDLNKSLYQQLQSVTQNFCDKSSINTLNQTINTLCEKFINKSRKIFIPNRNEQDCEKLDDGTDYRLVIGNYNQTRRENPLMEITFEDSNKQKIFFKEILFNGQLIKLNDVNQVRKKNLPTFKSVNYFNSDKSKSGSFVNFNPEQLNTINYLPLEPQSQNVPTVEIEKRLAEKNAKSGQVRISLAWNNLNDLDLHCIEPSGFEIFYQAKKSPTNGELDIDANAGGHCTTTPVENIYWPENQAPKGKYEIHVHFFAKKCEIDDTPFTVIVRTNNKIKEINDKVSLACPKKLIYSFDL